MGAKIFTGRPYGAILAAVTAVFLSAGSAAVAACPDDAGVAALAAKVLAGTPSSPLGVTTIAEGLCTQGKLVPLLEKTWGPPIGYKAGLTTKAAQERFGVSEPVRGVLLKNMMLPTGASVPATFGATPRFEADMIVVVASPAINDATTPEQVLANLSAIYPFIELPDLTVSEPKDLNGPEVTAINVGARLGVLGAPIPVDSVPALADALATMTVLVTDQDGKELAKAPGAAILGQPLNAVLWLKNSGIRLKAGDLLSLGSFGPMMLPKPGLTATVAYQGLPGNPSVTVSFR